MPRGLIEILVPRVQPIASEPALLAQYKKWEDSRSGFLVDLNARDPDAVARGWQP